jgi:hypothetical protein
MLSVGTVHTVSAATEVQVMNSSRPGSRDIEHIGSANDDSDLAVLKPTARHTWPPGRPSLTLA